MLFLASILGLKKLISSALSLLPTIVLVVEFSLRGPYLSSGPYPRY